MKSKSKVGCVEFAAKLIGDTWTLMIIQNLSDGPKRFSLLQQQIKVNPRTLSARLDLLEASHIITRTVFPEVPIKVEYSLTRKGQDLLPTIKNLAKWGEKYSSLDN